jgi:futalosine hydrolase
MKNDILLVSATKEEISALLNISDIKSETTTDSNKTIISAEIDRIGYDILITGPSVINASHALTIALERHRPKIIIQTGYAGVFKESNLKIGDISIATEERYIHTGVESHSSYMIPADLPFELIENAPGTKSGVYRFNKEYTDSAYQILLENCLAKRYSIAKGTVLTVSTITATQETATHLSKAFSPLMEAMEGAASAHIAALYNLPFLEIRSGSNYVGERDKTKWNTAIATERISFAIASVIKKIL